MDVSEGKSSISGLLKWKNAKVFQLKPHWNLTMDTFHIIKKVVNNLVLS